MKQLLLLSVLLVGAFSVKAQKYYVKIDSLTYLKMLGGKEYKLGLDSVSIKVLQLSKIEGDSFYFEGQTLHYKDIKALKNPKRKAFFDVLSYPFTIGSCVAMSAFPIIYARGYFTSDANGMLNALAIFIGETIVFAASRSYISRNKKWIDFSKLEKLEFVSK